LSDLGGDGQPLDIFLLRLVDTAELLLDGLSHLRVQQRPFKFGIELRCVLIIRIAWTFFEPGLVGSG